MKCILVIICATVAAVSIVCDKVTLMEWQLEGQEVIVDTCAVTVTGIAQYTHRNVHNHTGPGTGQIFHE